MKTVLMELKEKLQIEVNRLCGAVHGTDQYGYRGAMENIIKDIDAQMLGKEKQQLIDAHIAGMEFIAVDPKTYEEDAEDYYNETFKP